MSGIDRSGVLLRTISGMGIMRRITFSWEYPKRLDAMSTGKMSIRLYGTYFIHGMGSYTTVPRCSSHRLNMRLCIFRLCHLYESYCVQRHIFVENPISA